ncbi:MAG: Spy/CpxP family protein refolding chaperone [Rhodocyclaceae bacterium]|nr:Spy/CpxP family protein refolding chaperone [Rhodocyclaceae bacterium]
MNRLQKITTLCVATLGLAAGMAQAEMGDMKGPGDCGPQWQQRKPDPARMAKFMEKRMAQIHDALKLAPAQEPAWNVFADKVKPVPMAERPDFEALSKLPTPERLDKMQALAKERQERGAAHAAAVKEFYAQLNPEQQKVFDAEFMKHLRGGPASHGKMRKHRPE